MQRQLCGLSMGLMQLAFCLTSLPSLAAGDTLLSVAYGERAEDKPMVTAIENDVFASWPDYVDHYRLENGSVQKLGRVALSLRPEQGGAWVHGSVVAKLDDQRWLWLYTEKDRAGAVVAPYALGILNTQTGEVKNISQKLRICVTVFGEEYCDPTQIGQVEVREDGAIVVAAGSHPGLYITQDEGQTWKALSGDYPLQSDSCYPASFILREQSILFGGECPLDSAFVEIADFNGQKVDEGSRRFLASRSYLSNRAAWSLTEIASSKRYFAGVEGGLVEVFPDALAGQPTKVFRIEHPISSQPSSLSDITVDLYPYYEGVVAADSQPDWVVAWGSNPGLGGTVQVSYDGGTSFQSVSSQTFRDPRLIQVKSVMFDARSNKFYALTLPDAVRTDVERKIEVVEVMARRL